MRGERHRGLFPFPVPEVRPSNAADGELSRGTLRRLDARRHADEWVHDIVVALNSMFAGEEQKGNFVAGLNPTLSQRICLERVRQAVLEAGKPPEDLSGQGALSELRANAGYTAEPVSLAPMDVDLVSLPTKGPSAATLEMIFEEEAENFSHRLQSKVLAEGDVKRRKDECGLKRPYMDPLLRGSGRKYAEFCRKLESCGLIEYRQSMLEQVGLFTVWKKNGRQRLVVDARLSNLHFSEPETVRLATGATFSAIEVDEGPALEIGGVDIADAFYHIELPEYLRELFALPPVRAGDVGCDHIGKVKLKQGSWVYPCLKVTPMGWSHALWVCQTAHVHIVDKSPWVDARLRCVDRRRVPDVGDYVHTQYVDNFVAFSQKPGRAKDLAEKIGVELNNHGLPTHEVEAGAGLETLGWLFAAGHPTVTITTRRLWRMRLATLELLKDGKANGKLIEKLIGHFTFAGLLQRGFLSVFQASYIFVKKHYTEVVELWPEVRRELRWASALLCLIRKDLAAQWSPRVHATDASMWGRGICVTSRPLDEIKELGKMNERWRFSADEERQVVSSGLDLGSQLPDVETLKHDKPLHLEHSFEGVVEVPLSFIGEDWSKVDSAGWDRVEPIPILEGRSVVWLLQHLARSQKNLGKKHLLLTDSMSVTLALSKGRSSCRTMNRICRQVAALELMSGMHVHLRWIPSELNPADLPSRAQDLESFSLVKGLEKFKENHAASGSKQGPGSWRRSALASYARQEGERPCARGGECSPRGQDGSPQKAAGISEAEAARQLRGSSQHRPEDLPRAACGHHPSREQLQEGLVGDSGLGASQEPPLQHADRDRPCDGQPSYRDVLPGPGPRRWCHLGLCDPLLSGRHPEDHRPQEVIRGDEGVPQIGACKRATPNAVSHVVRPGARHLAAGPGDGSLVVDGVGNMLQTRRGLEAAQERPCSAIPTMPSLGADSQQQWTRRQARPRRGCQAPVDEDNIKGGRDRRGGVVGSELPQGSRTNARQLGEEHGRLRSDLQLPNRRCNRVVQPGPGRAQVRQGRDELHLPAATWVGQHRRALRPSQFDRSAEARQMADSQKRATLQQRGSHCSSVREPHLRTEARVRSGRAVDLRDLRCWHLVRGSSSSCGLELFSGSGHFSRAMRRKLKKVWCFEVDSCHGPQFDLTSRSFQQHVFRLLRSGKVAYVWLGTPCSSWSRARRNDGHGPGPLRDDGAYLMGFPNLNAKDTAKVHLGNTLMRFSAKVFRICLSLKIPVALENPHTSRIWLASPIKHLLHHKMTNYGYTDFCQDGKPFRKRTRLLWANADLRYALRHCDGPRGICSRTALPHQQLAGTQGGQFLTLLAQPYPHRLCDRLATAFQHAVMHRAAAPLEQFFMGRGPETVLGWAVQNDLVPRIRCAGRSFSTAQRFE